jgi:phage portal protein BeeE
VCHFRLFSRPSTPAKTASADEARSLSDPSEWLLDLLQASPALSGVSVTPATAMRCTPVRATVGAIAETIGVSPLITYERDGEARERTREHSVHVRLHDAANACARPRFSRNDSPVTPCCTITATHGSTA